MLLYLKKPKPYLLFLFFFILSLFYSVIVSSARFSSAPCCRPLLSRATRQCRARKCSPATAKTRDSPNERCSEKRRTNGQLTPRNFIHMERPFLLLFSKLVVLFSFLFFLIISVKANKTRHTTPISLYLTDISKIH